ncbi:MAG: glycosyltransferase family 61 protein, partial [Leptolyngbyaceae cyanobacterium MO_188.B28]|nr:glycosyltransferase family 61 protein [Leptolyngbyaceae cyanobacterium MO_188.B28]
MKFWVEPGKYAKEILGDFRLNWVSINNLDSRLKADFNRCQMLLESISTCQAPEMNFFPEATSIQEETYTTPDIYTVNLRGVYLCTEYNILYTEDLNIIEDSISAKRDLNRFDIKFFRNKKSGVISEACSIFRSYKNGYYHTLIDNLPRLYLLNHNRFSDTDLIKILCTSEPTKVEKFYLDRLLPNNAQITVIDQNKNYLMENLIFPSFLSRRFSGFLPSEYLNWFIGKTAPKRSRKKVNRIFISRVSTYKGSQRCILNE